MLQTQSTDFELVEDLYNKYSRQAYGLALKILRNATAAEDAVHEAFLRYWRNPASYDPEKGPFIKWFLTVVHNISVDQLRKTARTVSFTLDDAPEWLDNIVDKTLPIEDEVWLKLQRTEIQAALQVLPFEQRHCIELAFFKGLTHSQIALETTQPVGTVKSRIRQGLLKLKVQLNAATVINQFTKTSDYSLTLIASNG